MKKYIEKLQFITHDIAQHSHINQVQLACEAGAKWIQYRCLSKTDQALLADLEVISSICDDWGATLIVTDHVHLRGEADIQGFHIEDMAANFKALRQQVGEAYTLGGSANTIDGLLRLAAEGADYAGFGPFAITSTKPNQLPLLGIAGYEEAIVKLSAKGIDLPVLAVGGVTLTDVPALLTTGIYGVAVSAAINQAADLYAAYQDFYNELAQTKAL